MKIFFYKLPRNIIKCFSGYNFIFHFLAVVLTYMITTSGFDEAYFDFFQGTSVYRLLFPAVALGALLPLIVPILMLALGKARKNKKIINTAFALGQAATIGWGISTFYKMFTGRIPPPFRGGLF